MLLTNVHLLLAALLASAQAFSVSPDTPDGVYFVSTDSNGHEVHAKLADPTPFVETRRDTISVRMRSLMARDITTCGGGGELNHADTDAANTDLDVQCGGPGGVLVPGGHDWYSKRGGTVAFFCNFGGNNRCDSNSRHRAALIIGSVCGPYRPGWTGPDAGYLTYGFDVVTSRFCGRH